MIHLEVFNDTSKDTELRQQVLSDGNASGIWKQEQLGSIDNKGSRKENKIGIKPEYPALLRQWMDFKLLLQLP